MENINYEEIIDAVKFSFEEYIDEDGMQVVGATSKTIEEDYNSLTKNLFSMYSYLVRLGIESIDRSQIADYLYEKLSDADKIIKKLKYKEVEFLKKDLELYKMKQEADIYQVIETTSITKSRIDYILSNVQEE